MDKDLFYKGLHKKIEDFFKLFMNTLAKNNGIDFWLEKTPNHSLYLEEILNYHPKAKFIFYKLVQII